jgi:hypothetical protein
MSFDHADYLLAKRVMVSDSFKQVAHLDAYARIPTPLRANTSFILVLNPVVAAKRP